MKCAWYQRWLTRSADDELTGWRDALLRRHLAGCGRCVADLKELRQIRELVAGQKAHYAGKLDDSLFWQQLRARLQKPRQPEDMIEVEADELAGIAFFGLFPARRLAWSAVAVALLVAALVGVQVLRVPQDGGLAFEVPLLPPVGEGRVHFTEVKSTKGMWASVVKFDKPDTDIAVIWVDGMPYMGRDLKHPGEDL